MSDTPFSWLTEAAAGETPPDTEDPWGDVDLEIASLTGAQEAFLASFADQPPIPRLRRLDDRLRAFEAEEPPPTDP